MIIFIYNREWQFINKFNLLPHQTRQRVAQIISTCILLLALQRFSSLVGSRWDRFCYLSKDTYADNFLELSRNCLINFLIFQGRVQEARLRLEEALAPYTLFYGEKRCLQHINVAAVRHQLGAAHAAVQVIFLCSMYNIECNHLSLSCISCRTMQMLVGSIPSPWALERLSMATAMIQRVRNETEWSLNICSKYIVYINVHIYTM